MVVGQEGEEKLPVLVPSSSKVHEIAKSKNAFMCYYYLSLKKIVGLGGGAYGKQFVLNRCSYNSVSGFQSHFSLF